MSLDLDDLERKMAEAERWSAEGLPTFISHADSRALLAEVRRLMAQAALMDTNRIAWREWSQDLCAALDAAGVERPKPLTDSAYVARYNADPPEAGFSVDLDWALKGAPAPSATGEAMTQRQDALLHGKWADLKASKMAALIQTAPSATHWLTPRDFQGGPLPYPAPYMGPRGAQQTARWGAFPESSR